MKTMLVIGRKHVEFNAAKHTIVAGNLCHKADPLWVIGRITGCYSEPNRDDIQPSQTLQLTD